MYFFHVLSIFICNPQVPCSCSCSRTRAPICACSRSATDCGSDERAKRKSYKQRCLSVLFWFFFFFSNCNVCAWMCVCALVPGCRNERGKWIISLAALSRRPYLVNTSVREGLFAKKHMYSRKEWKFRLYRLRSECNGSANVTCAHQFLKWPNERQRWPIYSRSFWQFKRYPSRSAKSQKLVSRILQLDECPASAACTAG